MLKAMFYKKVKNGMEVYLKVTPNAAKSEFCGVVEGDFGRKLLRVKIAAVPDGGKANKELVKFMAKKLGVAPSCLDVLSGKVSRRKTVEVSGDVELVLKELLRLAT